MERMSFKDTPLAREIMLLQNKERDMYEHYSELFNKVSETYLRDKLRLLRKQELGHVQMIEKIKKILADHILE